jgi:hypothetical protein
MSTAPLPPGAVDPAREPTPEELAQAEALIQRKAEITEKLISQRDTLLADADSKPVTPEWNKYRQHLKDLPAMAVNIPMPIDLDEDGNLVGVEWPDVPDVPDVPVVDAEKKSEE